MKLVKLIFSLVFVFTLNLTKAEVDTLYYLNENFEDVESEIEWTSTRITGITDWGYREGGNDFNPIDAKSGVQNAIFYYGGGGRSALLSSPKVDLSTSRKPLLSFGHAMGTSFFGTDEVYLLFKAGAASQWDTIQYYNTTTGDDDNTYWKERNFNIDEIGAKYLCEDFQLGFLAISNAGHGVCIDSVVIAEKDTIDKFIRKLEFENIEYDLIPSGATNIPLARAAIEVMGNTGSAILNFIKITSESTSDALFQNGSFSLYLTRNDVFSSKIAGNSTLLSSGKSISGNEIEFTGLDTNLLVGFNYLWLVADISSSAVWGDEIAFALDAEAISIIDTLIPASPTVVSIKNYINESVFFDGFESLLGWTLDGIGDFEIDAPQGLEINGSKDPSTAFGGNNVLGTDLTDDGGYPVNVNTPYYATSPTINNKYFNRTKVNFHEWVAFYSGDIGVVEVSDDNGASWTTIWNSTNDAPSKASQWSETTISAITPDLLDRKEEVKIRFGVTETHDGTVNYIGFNIDNLAIVGNHLDIDVAVTEILSPFNDCLGFGNDTVIAIFKNYAEGPTPDRIPIFYGLWGIDSVLVRDTIEGPIAQDDSVIFKFSTLAAFPKADIYDKFIVGVELSGDDDLPNDTLTKPLFIQDNNTPAHFEDFEYKGGIWKPSENSTWSARIPDASIGPVPDSPHAWVLSPFGDYINSDTSSITGSCYDLTYMNRYIIQAKYWLESEVNTDGFNIEYSIDDEETWNLVDTSQYGRSWGWYTNNVSSLGDIGWSGNSGGWTSMHELLPASFATEPKVKFRVLWASSDSINARGMAFNDFEIFPAPHDIGISSVLSPVDDCEGNNATTVSVRVKNYGYNTMRTNDTIIIGVDFESDTPVIDTLILASDLPPGDSVDLVVNTDIDISVFGTYNISAYTLIEDDPWYYLANNDTAHYSFTVWKNPVIELADTIGTRQPDTLTIIPIYPDWVAGYTYLWSPSKPEYENFDSLNVTQNGFGDAIYKITATEPLHSCSHTDSVNVLLLFSDAGTDSILSPFSSCELTNNEFVQVRIKNFGTDSIFSIENDTAYIVVAYQVAGDVNIYADTLTIKESIRSQKTILHTFTNYPYDFSGVQEYTITTWAYFLGGDVNNSNDSTTKSISVFGYTALDLGNDVVVQTLNYTLDAGPNFVSYAWNTGDTTQTAFLDASVNDASGLYYVDATDINGCDANDSINVLFSILDILAHKLVAPVTSCNRDGDNYIRLLIKNNGSDTIQVTDSIRYSYIIDGGDIVVETAVPDREIPPAEQYTHQFNNSIDFSEFKEYTIELTASAFGDLRPSNDSVSGSFRTNTNPTINLGEHNDPILDFDFELDAGTGPFTYLWQDNSTITQTYTATETGDYGVVATDTNTGCFGGDTVHLIFDIIDYSVTGIDGILGGKVCQSAGTEISVWVANLGNQPRSNAKITVGYQINSETAVNQDFTISGVWGSGTANAKRVVMSELAYFNLVGSNTLVASINHPADINPDNDTKTIAVISDESPLVDFGGDTLHVALPYILDPGLHDHYEWQDGFDGQKYNVTSTSDAKYTVTVKDNDKSCITTRSVWIEPSLAIGQVLSNNLEFRLYPNPASEYLNIEAEDVTGKELYIEIYNIANQLIWSDYHEGFGVYMHKLEISGFNEGVYMLRIRNAEINHVQRFIVQ